MGTNFYAVRNRPSVEEPIHIGKRSAGWMFHFQSQNASWHEPPVVWNTYNQVKEWLHKYTVENTDYVILDEYDNVWKYDDFIKMIYKAQGGEHGQTR